MGSFVSFLRRNYASFNPPTAALPTGKKPLRIGVLSTANITHMSLILPARSHPGVEVAAIGGRDKKKTENFAKKFGIKKVYLGSDGNNAGYQKLLDDPEIDAVYIPLPHVHHYEWTIKALSAGKHVLVEKPIANTAEETRKMHDLAEEKGLVLLEGNHPRCVSER